MHLDATTDLSSLSDSAAEAFLKKERISLTVAEARHFQKEIGRPLTTTELTILSIQGSEHCSYRSSRQYLRRLPTTGQYVIMGPGEDAGIVEIARDTKNNRYGLVIGHESHNHPSQIVPFEGAATGVGGCVRDIICMGARVTGSLDMLRFGDPTKKPQRTIFQEAVRGIAGYGNPLGIPNLGGDTEFSSEFDSNCLVNVVATGVVKESDIVHSYAPKDAAKNGYDIILVGKPTDRSGFGGAAFSSLELSEADAETNKGAVQEPNPFLERCLLAATTDLFRILKEKKQLHRISCKDLGAGGIVCASVEQVAPSGFGATIDLTKVPTSEPLPPQVIACSETQERLCFICHPSLTQLILTTFNTTWALPQISRGAQAAVIGKVTTGNYVLTHGEALVTDAPGTILTEGLRYNRPHKKAPTKKISTRIPAAQRSPLTLLKKLLTHPNAGSRLCITEKYDKNVLGATLRDGDSGAGAVQTPLLHESAEPTVKATRVILGTGGDSSLGRLSATLQGMHAVCEAVANVVQVGAEPRALTDCLNYGNPEDPYQMQELIDGITGLKKAAEALELPFVSGNVSLYNYAGTRSVPPSAIVSCVGVIPDGQSPLPQSFTAAGEAVYLVGTRASRLGGSLLLASIGGADSAYSLSPTTFVRESAFIRLLAKKALPTSCRDLHRGGIALALTEMSLLSDIGVRCKKLTASQLFSENPGYLITVPQSKEATLSTLAQKAGVRLTRLGDTLATPLLALGTEEVALAALRTPYETTLRTILVTR